MYKLLLILKYLRRKLAPMFAALAVTLCTAMVIIVISVMGGFLDLLRESVHQLSGDVIITAGSLTGFPHYEALIEALEEQPEIAAAAPVLRTYGLLNLGGSAIPVQIEGIRPRDLDRVVHYRRSLHWSAKDYLEELQGSGLEPDLLQRRQEALSQLDLEGYGMSLEPPAAWQPPNSQPLPGVVLGIELNPLQMRDEYGQYSVANSAVGMTIALTTVPLTQQGSVRQLDATSRSFLVVNEFKSGHYEVDANRAYVPLEALQQMTDMDQRQVWNYDPQTLEPVGDPMLRPARVTEILLRGEAGYNLDEVRTAARNVAGRFVREHADMPLLLVQTWEQQYADLLGAVANEKGLVTFLFIIISIVAIVMVATTFYMIVLEKTRDIGVLRAIGASRAGIMNVFLGYGLAIGIVGSLAGLALAYLIVTHLNQLQDVLATRMATLLGWCGVAAAAGVLGAILGGAAGRRRDAAFESGLAGLLLGAAAVAVVAFFRFDLLEVGPFNQWNTMIGWRMWDPRIYAFDRIPDRVDAIEATVIVLGAIASSVIGSLIPALLAARLDPIEALRYE